MAGSPPTTMTLSGTDAPAWARVGAPPLPRVAGGTAGDTGGCPGLDYGVWGLLHEEEVTNHLELVHRCSEVVGCCGTMGCSVLVWGHLRADSQLPLPARAAGKGLAFGSLFFPAAAVPAWSGLCLQSWPCCWHLRGCVGPGGPPPRPPGCLWGSAELLGASERIAMLLRTCWMWQGRGKHCCAGGVRTKGSLLS